MKLIIDIPERDYDLACKYPNALIATYAHYIKDGTPYVERPHGEWIVDEEHSITMTLYKCTNCNYFGGATHYRYCPHCGADMRGGRE